MELTASTSMRKYYLDGDSNFVSGVSIREEGIICTFLLGNLVVQSCCFSVALRMGMLGRKQGPLPPPP
jgi:hypothetical protein